MIIGSSICLQKILSTHLYRAPGRDEALPGILGETNATFSNLCSKFLLAFLACFLEPLLESLFCLTIYLWYGVDIRNCFRQVLLAYQAFGYLNLLLLLCDLKYRKEGFGFLLDNCELALQVNTKDEDLLFLHAGHGDF